MNHHCLDCDHPINNHFCPNCGQKTTTHRFSLKHFFLHDLVHGVFHLDKGFIYTIKELFTRPGHSIRAYVQGKRAKHFNYFTFIILTITVGHIIGNYSDTKMIDTTHYFSNDKAFLTEFEKISRENPKLFTLGRIPFLALFTLLFFRKSKQNFTEHLVLNTYKVSAELLIATVFTLFTVFFKSPSVFNYVFNAVAILTLLYSIWFYYQYFSSFGYSKVGLFIRSLLTSVILILVIASVTTFMIGIKAGFTDTR